MKPPIYQHDLDAARSQTRHAATTYTAREWVHPTHGRALLQGFGSKIFDGALVPGAILMLHSTAEHFEPLVSWPGEWEPRQ